MNIHLTLGEKLKDLRNKEGCKRRLKKFLRLRVFPSPPFNGWKNPRDKPTRTSSSGIRI